MRELLRCGPARPGLTWRRVEKGQIDSSYKVCRVRNSGEAYRKFRSIGGFARAHETMVGLLRRLVGALTRTGPR